MNSVSFGSTFKVSNRNNAYEQQSKFIDYSMKKFGSDMELSDTADGKRVVTLVVPDEKDNKIEAFCKYNGIEYTKLNTADLLAPRQLDMRIMPAKGNMVKTYVNAEKLEALAKTQSNNIEHCEKDYEKYFKNDVDRNLKTGNQIRPSVLHIQPMTSKEDLTNYIDTFGADRLNPDMVNITLLGVEPDKHEQCMYAALKDKGYKNIPVYMYKESYEIASKLGILEDKIK